MPTNILLQTTIPYAEDDWNIGRFSLLRKHLASLTDENGEPLYDITARDREKNFVGNDEVLENLDTSGFDQLWLFAVDAGNGLTSDECAGITRFRQRGGGIFSIRDHDDLGSSLCTLGGIGAAHYFHSKHPDPDDERNARDNQVNMKIDYPNYFSGDNGDYQRITVVDTETPLLKRADGRAIEYFPAHPHEGGVGAPPDDPHAHVIATGTSMATERPFNLVVAFERGADKHGNHCGRAIAESSFHHLVDYNWDIDMGCPTFLEEQPGLGYKDNPELLEDIKQYVANLAAWLSAK
jgi:hypothetical protein